MSQPVNTAFSFFNPFKKRTNLPPNSFRPTQKNCIISSEYLMHLVSDKLYHDTTSQNRENAILFNCFFFFFFFFSFFFFFACTSSINVVLPTLSSSFNSEGKLFCKYLIQLSSVSAVSLCVKLSCMKFRFRFQVRECEGIVKCISGKKRICALSEIFVFSQG